MLGAAAKKAAAGADDGSGSLAGDDEEFGLDLVFSPASGAKATAATASGGGGGGGGAAGGTADRRASRFRRSGSSVYRVGVSAGGERLRERERGRRLRLGVRV